MTANEYVKKRFGRYMNECTYEEIYAALLEFVKEKAKETIKLKRPTFSFFFFIF